MYNTQYNADAEEIAMEQLMNSKQRDRLYNRLDVHQKEYREAFEKFKMVLVDEKAGTGKTVVAVMAGLEHLRQGKCKKIMYVRFPSKRGQKLGALPGGPDEKEAIYMYPFIEALNDCGIQTESIEILKEQGLIEMCTDISLRGRTLKDTFIIVDETQNAVDIEELQLVLTRIKDSRSSSAIIGHSEQTDSNVKKYGKAKYNAFEVYQIHMVKKHWATKIKLYNNYRGAISQWADEVMQTVKELEG